MHDDVQVDDLGTVEHYVNLWVELEVAVGFQRLMRYLLHLPQILNWQRKLMSKTKAVRQRTLSEMKEEGLTMKIPGVGQEDVMVEPVSDGHCNFPDLQPMASNVDGTLTYELQIFEKDIIQCEKKFISPFQCSS